MIIPRHYEDLQVLHGNTMASRACLNFEGVDSCFYMCGSTGSMWATARYPTVPVPSGSTVLCLDYAQDGIGSNSCGPRLLKKYRFDQEMFAFTIKLAPFVSRSDIPGGDRNGFGTA